MDHKKDGLAFLQGQVSDDCKVNIKEFSMLQTKFSTIGGSLQGKLIFFSAFSRPMELLIG